MPIEYLAHHWSGSIVLLLIAISVAIALAVYLKPKQPTNVYFEYLDKMGIASSQMEFEAFYPAYGLWIQSNSPINLPLSIYAWDIKYGQSCSKVVATGFTGNTLLLSIDHKKAKEVKLTELSFYNFLLDREVIAPNENLINE